MPSIRSASADLGDWDVVIAGAGPAGSTAAALLARDGRRVLVLEKERFPRYHIGESLIPGCLRILNALGIRDEVERAGFTVKRGGTFIWGAEGEREWRFSFDEQGGEPNYAYQVDRSRFDQILLNHARASGAEVHEGVAVRSIDVDNGDPVIVSDAGVARARYVIDATGQTSILGRKCGGRHFDESLRNVAIWRYYRGCGRLPEPRAGDIAIVRRGDGWFWYIPLEEPEGGLTSLGVVMSAESYRQRGSNAEAIYDQSVAETRELDRWLEHAYPVSETRITADWSYRSRNVIGDRWILVGDAAGFIDPLLSTGCYLAMTAGYLAGLCLGSVLSDPGMRAVAFNYYRASYDRVINELHAMVRIFYRTIRAQDVFDGAQAILGSEGDPRQLFVRLAAGLSEESVARGDVGYFEETGLGSEVFGEQAKVPDRYGATFATDQDRILGPVDPKDLPPGIEGDMMLVERDVRLRLVAASEVAALEAATGKPMALADVRTDEDAVAWLRHIDAATPGPTAVLVFRDASDADPVAVCFSVAVESKPHWARVGDVAMSYIAEAEANPFDRPGSRGLLEAILRTAKSCDPVEAASPEAIQHALAARLQHPGWQLIARAISSSESVAA
jgi:flavin-dependent dehydrogenase